MTTVNAKNVASTIVPNREYVWTRCGSTENFNITLQIEEAMKYWMIEEIEFDEVNDCWYTFQTLRDVDAIEWLRTYNTPLYVNQNARLEQVYFTMSKRDPDTLDIDDALTSLLENGVKLWQLADELSITCNSASDDLDEPQHCLQIQKAANLIKEARKILEKYGV